MTVKVRKPIRTNSWIENPPNFLLDWKVFARNRFRNTTVKFHLYEFEVQSNQNFSRQIPPVPPHADAPYHSVGIYPIFLRFCDYICRNLWNFGVTNKRVNFQTIKVFAAFYDSKSKFALFSNTVHRGKLSLVMKKSRIEVETSWIIFTRETFFVS